MSDSTSLGDRMKLYEGLGAPRLMPGLPICVRLDGVRFSRFRKKLIRPFDARLMGAFDDLLMDLMIETGAKLGHTFSDEVSLVLFNPPPAQPFYGGKPQKIASVLASYTCRRFQWPPEVGINKPLFDARAWTVPSLDEAANTLLWRIQDARRNSIAMCAQARFSHNELQGKNSDDMRDMLRSASEPWGVRPARERIGAIAYRHTVEKELEPEVLEKIPDGKRPKGPIERSVVDLVVEEFPADFTAIRGLL